MRVLFVSCDPRDGAVTRYRAGHFAQALQTAGHSATIAWIGDWRIALGQEIVVLHRICANAEGQALARAVRRSGARLVYGADDLVFTSADDLSVRADAHARMLRQADAALLATRYLADAARKSAPHTPAYVLRNFPALPQPCRDAAGGGPDFALGYFSGTPTHDSDLASIAVPLARTLERFPGSRLLLVGPVAVPEPLRRFGSRIVTLPQVSWQQLPQLLGQVAVNLAPLDDRTLNAGKSELKWLEAAAVGVPTIASAVGGFAEAICPNEDGVLAVSAQDWERHLARLLTDETLRRRLGERARERVQSDIQILRRRQEIVQTFERLLDFPATPLVRPALHLNPLGWAKGRIKLGRKGRR